MLNFTLRTNWLKAMGGALAEKDRRQGERVGYNDQERERIISVTKTKKGVQSVFTSSEEVIYRFDPS